MGLREGNDASGARADDSETCDLIDTGFGDFRRRGRQISQFRERRSERFGKRFDEAAGNRGGGLHRDLLPDNSAKPPFKPVEGARHARAGRILDQRTQDFVAA